MKVVFLGTSAMQPTKERNLFSLLISYKNENILVDCGEGTQRQFKFANLKPTKITKIFLTHLHGDHVFGLPGFLQNLEVNGYSRVLDIYAPKGINEFINFIKKLGTFEKLKIRTHVLEHDGKIFENKDFILETYKLEHTAPCFGLRFVEKDRRKINIEYTKKFGLIQHPLLGKLQKGQDIVWKGKKITAKEGTILVKGKIIAVIADTRVCENCYKIAKDADLLICEATYLSDLEEKAKEYTHLTAKQAAEIAKRSNAKKLVLTHFSQRYKNVSWLKEEAKEIFPNVECAKDLMEISV